MNKMKSSSLIFATVLSLGALVGCNSKNKDPGSITIGVMNAGGEYETLKALTDAYLKKEENAGKIIKILKINENYDSFVNKRLYVNQMPDIIQVYDYSSQYWTNEDIFLPLDDYMERDNIDLSKYYSSSIEMARSSVKDDKMYWIPRDYNKVVCAYNKAIFDIAEVPYPTDNWTYSDFVTTCNALMAKKDDILENYSTRSTLFWAADMSLNWQAVYYPAIKSFGGDLIDKDNNKAFKNIDACLDTINMLLELADNDIAVSPTTTNTSAFSNKQCAMKFVTRPEVPSYIKNIGGTDPIDFVSMPSYEGVDTSYIGMGCTGYGMVNGIADEKKDFAWDFLKFVFTEEGQTVFAQSGSGEPVLKELAMDPNGPFAQCYPNLNNAAFTQFENRDIPMNFMDGFQPKKQLGIYSFLITRMTADLFKKSRGTERDNYFKGDFKKNFEETF